MLIEGEQHAVLPVDLRIGLRSIVEQQYIGNVAQAHGRKRIQSQVEQHEGRKLFCGLYGIANVYEPLRIIVRSGIAGRHGKVLRAEDRADGRKRNDFFGVGGGIGGLACLPELRFGIIKLPLSFLHLQASVVDLPLSGA